MPKAYKRDVGRHPFFVDCDKRRIPFLMTTRKRPDLYDSSKGAYQQQ